MKFSLFLFVFFFSSVFGQKAETFTYSDIFGTIDIPFVTGTPIKVHVSNEFFLEVDGNSNFALDGSISISKEIGSINTQQEIITKPFFLSVNGAPAEGLNPPIQFIFTNTSIQETQINDYCLGSYNPSFDRFICVSTLNILKEVKGISVIAKVTQPGILAITSTSNEGSRLHSIERAIDCKGVVGGTAQVDVCGVCGGNNQSCCLNYLGVRNVIWDWLLLEVSISDVITRLTSLFGSLKCANDNIPPFDDGVCDGTLDNGEEMTSALNIGSMLQENSEYLTNCLNPFSELVPKWTCDLNADQCNCA